MPNILDYIEWRGDLDFRQSSLNEVDNLIFSKLSYLDFSNIVEKDSSKPLSVVAEEYIKERGYSKIGMLLNKNFPKLLKLIGESKRYGNIHVSDVVDNTDDKEIIQFAAMTFELPNNQRFIAYRGTDDSLIGWKEDFMMSIMDTVPAQDEALQYLKAIENKYPDDDFYLGGHSKGGNLAVYSAIHSNDSIKDKIIKVFNNDGPGFKDSLVETDKYLSISSKIKTLVPKSSIVGMLLEHEESYDVVQCSIKQSGLLQHDGFTWEVLGTSFIHLSDVDGESKLVNKTLKGVLNNMTIEQREKFTNALFDILSANNHKSLMDIEKGHVKSLFAMGKAYDGLDKVTRKELKDGLGLLFEEGFKQLLNNEKFGKIVRRTKDRQAPQECK